MSRDAVLRSDDESESESVQVHHQHQLLDMASNYELNAAIAFGVFFGNLMLDLFRTPPRGWAQGDREGMQVIDVGEGFLQRHTLASVGLSPSPWYSVISQTRIAEYRMMVGFWSPALGPRGVGREDDSELSPAQRTRRTKWITLLHILWLIHIVPRALKSAARAFLGCRHTDGELLMAAKAARMIKGFFTLSLMDARDDMMETDITDADLPEFGVPLVRLRVPVHDGLQLDDFPWSRRIRRVGPVRSAGSESSDDPDYSRDIMQWVGQISREMELDRDSDDMSDSD